MNLANVINFTQPVTNDWLVNLILWLVTICGSVGLGVILFTLILKLITLPFDFISKIQMRKNSVLMEKMRPELEKLQKQYANDKEKYSTKMMALYKKHGYSMWGSCLPMILTLVIFIIAINAFTDYSQFQNRQYFYDMSLSYNSVIYDAFEEDGDLIKMKNGKLVFDDKELFTKGSLNGEVYELSNGEWIKITHIDSNNDNTIDKYSVEIVDEQSINYMPKTYIRYIRACNGGGTEFYKTEWEIINSNLANSNLLTQSGKNYTEYKASVIDNVTNKINSQNQTATPEEKEILIENKIAYDFLLDIQQTRAATSYRSNDTSFLWVKNIWVTDSPLKNPIESSWDSFKSTNEYTDNNVNATDYANLIGKLNQEKTEPNGYFILVLLTAASSLIMQLITNKANKAQMELQTVDGQGAQTNKMMTWLMPVMMAVFAFMYTAAFSIYIVLSNVISIGSTLLINVIVEKKYALPEKEGETTRSRVYVPKEEEKKEVTPKKPFFSFGPKEEETPANDFLTGNADKKKKKKN